MNTVYLTATFLTTGLILLALKPIALKAGLVDFPGGRKTHIRATPMIGGVAIFFGILLVCLLQPDVLAQFRSLLSLSALMLFIGMIDDLRDLKVNVRMLGHALVVVAMAVVANVQLLNLGDLLGLGVVELGIFSLPITVFATIGVINSINMVDGIDGLSGGLTIVTLSFLAILAFNAGNFAAVQFILIIVCSILAFLTLNFRRPWHNRKALVYLGDAGSTMLGFIIAWLLIDFSQGEGAYFAPVYALWFLAVPLFDTVSLLIKRPLSGKSPFSPGLDHLHHSFINRGFSVAEVVCLLLFIAVLMGSIGLLGLYYGANEWLMFMLFISLFAIYFILSDRERP